MKKFLLLLIMLTVPLTAYAKDVDIKNIDEYFEYLPVAVHDNWVPYKSNRDYEVMVRFKVFKNGTISTPVVVNSTNTSANNSVINAVTQGAPYKKLPTTYDKKSVEAQVVLKYIKNL